MRRWLEKFKKLNASKWPALDEAIRSELTALGSKKLSDNGVHFFKVKVHSVAATADQPKGNST